MRVFALQGQYLFGEAIARPETGKDNEGDGGAKGKRRSERDLAEAGAFSGSDVQHRNFLSQQKRFPSLFLCSRNLFMTLHFHEMMDQILAARETRINQLHQHRISRKV